MDVKRQKFIQSFISRGVLNFQEVKDLLAEIEVEGSKEQIAAFVIEVNQMIEPLNLIIKKGVQEDDGANFYCLVNTVETPISRMSSTYSPNELELFKKLVESIVDSEDGKIGSLAAMNLTDKLEKRMGKEEAQNFFNRLERDKWIKKDSDGQISLTVRTIVELDQYMKDLYPDLIKTCNLCSQICLLGESCQNCDVKIHKKCAERLFSRQGDDKRCPHTDCRAPWGQVVVR